MLHTCQHELCYQTYITVKKISEETGKFHEKPVKMIGLDFGQSHLLFSALSRKKCPFLVNDTLMEEGWQEN